jgi:hypothetical protein
MPAEGGHSGFKTFSGYSYLHLFRLLKILLAWIPTIVKFEIGFRPQNQWFFVWVIAPVALILLQFSSMQAYALLILHYLLVPEDLRDAIGEESVAGLKITTRDSQCWPTCLGWSRHSVSFSTLKGESSCLLFTCAGLLASRTEDVPTRAYRRLNPAWELAKDAVSRFALLIC